MPLSRAQGVSYRYQEPLAGPIMPLSRVINRVDANAQISYHHAVIKSPLTKGKTRRRGDKEKDASGIVTTRSKTYMPQASCYKCKTYSDYSLLIAFY